MARPRSIWPARERFISQAASRRSPSPWPAACAAAAARSHTAPRRSSHRARPRPRRAASRRCRPDRLRYSALPSARSPALRPCGAEPGAGGLPRRELPRCRSAGVRSWPTSACRPAWCRRGLAAPSARRRPTGAPLGEGNSTFLSFSAAESANVREAGAGRLRSRPTPTSRAGSGRRTTARLGELSSVLRARACWPLSTRVVPGASGRADLVELATPLTFERYTGRPRGLVGGVPQSPGTRGLRAHRIAAASPGWCLCGDTDVPRPEHRRRDALGVAAARAPAAQFSFSSIRSLNFGRRRRIARGSPRRSSRARRRR